MIDTGHMNNPKQTSLYVAYGGFIAVAISAGALNIAWLYIQTDFQLPLSALGILITCASIAQLTVSFNGGRLIQWLGVGKFLLIGSLFALSGMLGFILTPSWELLIIAGMLLGAGNSFMINGFNIFVASNYKASRVNWLHASFGVGATLGPILISVVVLDLDGSWRAGYGVMAVLMLILVFVLLATHKQWQLPTSASVEKEKSKKTKGVLQSPVVMLTIGVMFLSAGIETTTGQLSNNLFVNGRGFEPRTVATWISFYWLSYTIARLVTGTVIDRVSHNFFLRVSLFFSIVGTSLIWLNPNPTLNFVGLALIGIAIAPIAPTIMGDTPKRVGVDLAPTIIGYQNVGAGIGIAFFPSLAGVLAEVISLEIIPLYLIMIAMAMFIVHELLNFQENRESRYDLIESGND